MARWGFLLALALSLSLSVPVTAFAGSPPAPRKPPPTRTQTREHGIASWFRSKRPLTAAHRTLPIGSRVNVIASNGKAVAVTIRSRGPRVKGRVIDLSSDAFKKLAPLRVGLLRVRIELVKRVAAVPTDGRAHPQRRR